MAVSLGHVLSVCDVGDWKNIGIEFTSAIEIFCSTSVVLDVTKKSWLVQKDKNLCKKTFDPFRVVYTIVNGRSFYMYTTKYVVIFIQIILFILYLLLIFERKK